MILWWFIKNGVPAVEVPLEKKMDGNGWCIFRLQRCKTHFFGNEHSKNGVVHGKKNRSTPPKIDIEPENDGLEDDFPFPGVYSQVPC